MTDMPQDTGFRFTGRHMLFIMLAFFGCVIAANMALVYYASASWTGLVVQNSYVASQSFNEDTAKLKQAAAMGLTDAVHYHDGTLTLTLHDKSGAGVTATDVVMSLGLTYSDKADRTVTLAQDAPGVFSVATPLQAGVWNGKITANITGMGAWERIIRLTVKE